MALRGDMFALARATRGVGDLSAAVKRLGREVASTARRGEAMKRSFDLRRQTTSLQGLTRAGRGAGVMMTALSGSAGTLASGLAAAAAGATALAAGMGYVLARGVRFEAQLERSRLQLELMSAQYYDTAQAVEFARTETEKLAALAKSTPFDLRQISQAHGILEGFGGSVLNTEEILHGLIDAAALAGGAVDDLTESARQLGQAFTKGLQGRAVLEDLNVLIERRVLTGTGVQNIKKVIEEIKRQNLGGTLAGANMLTAAFAKELGKADGAADRLSETIVGLEGKALQAFEAAAGAIADATGATDAYRSTLEGIVAILETAEDAVKRFGAEGFKTLAMIAAWPGLGGGLPAAALAAGRAAAAPSRRTDDIHLGEPGPRFTPGDGGEDPVEARRRLTEAQRAGAEAARNLEVHNRQLREGLVALAEANRRAGASLQDVVDHYRAENQALVDRQALHERMHADLLEEAAAKKRAVAAHEKLRRERQSRLEDAFDDAKLRAAESVFRTMEGDAGRIVAAFNDAYEHVKRMEEASKNLENNLIRGAAAIAGAGAALGQIGSRVGGVGGALAGGIGSVVSAAAFGNPITTALAAATAGINILTQVIGANTAAIAAKAAQDEEFNRKYDVVTPRDNAALWGDFQRISALPTGPDRRRSSYQFARELTAFQDRGGVFSDTERLHYTPMINAYRDSLVLIEAVRREEDRRIKVVEKLSREYLKQARTIRSDLTQALSQARTALDGMRDAIGGAFDRAAIDGVIERMRELGIITDRVADAYRAMSDIAHADWRAMTRIAEQFDIGTGGFGKAFVQARVTGLGTEIGEAFRTITDLGGDQFAAAVGLLRTAVDDSGRETGEGGLRRIIEEALAADVLLPEILAEPLKALREGGVMVEEIARLRFGDPQGEARMGLHDVLREVAETIYTKQIEKVDETIEAIQEQTQKEIDAIRTLGDTLVNAIERGHFNVQDLTDWLGDRYDSIFGSSVGDFVTGILEGLGITEGEPLGPDFKDDGGAGFLEKLKNWLDSLQPNAAQWDSIVAKINADHGLTKETIDALALAWQTTGGDIKVGITGGDGTTLDDVLGDGGGGVDGIVPGVKGPGGTTLDDIVDALPEDTKKVLDEMKGDLRLLGIVVATTGSHIQGSSNLPGSLYGVSSRLDLANQHLHAIRTAVGGGGGAAAGGGGGGGDGVAPMTLADVVGKLGEMMGGEKGTLLGVIAAVEGLKGGDKAGTINNVIQEVANLRSFWASQLGETANLASPGSNVTLSPLGKTIGGGVKSALLPLFGNLQGEVQTGLALVRGAGGYSASLLDLKNAVDGLSGADSTTLSDIDRSIKSVKFDATINVTVNIDRDGIVETVVERLPAAIAANGFS